MADMVTPVHARNDKELQRKLNQIKVQHEALNPNKKVIVKVNSPNPQNVEYDEFQGTTFYVSVEILDEDDDDE